MIEDSIIEEDEVPTTDWKPPAQGKHGPCMRQIIRLEKKTEHQSQELRLSIGLNVAFMSALILRLALK